jgi:hypothetical protein
MNRDELKLAALCFKLLQRCVERLRNAFGTTSLARQVPDALRPLDVASRRGRGHKVSLEQLAEARVVGRVLRLVSSLVSTAETAEELANAFCARSWADGSDSDRWSEPREDLLAVRAVRDEAPQRMLVDRVCSVGVEQKIGLLQGAVRRKVRRRTPLSPAHERPPE